MVVVHCPDRFAAQCAAKVRMLRSWTLVTPKAVRPNEAVGQMLVLKSLLPFPVQRPNHLARAPLRPAFASRLCLLRVPLRTPAVASVPRSATCVTPATVAPRLAIRLTKSRVIAGWDVTRDDLLERRSLAVAANETISVAAANKSLVISSLRPVAA